MPTPETIDFSALLRPIDGANPAGRDLRVDAALTAPYRTMKEARNTARRIERALENRDPEMKEKPDWRPVLSLAQKSLAAETKDLEIAAWLIEALVREHGFAGVRDGFRLYRELVEQFWDNLYPLPDPDEASGDGEVPRRVATLNALNEGALVGPLESITIVDPKTLGPIGVSAYEQSDALEQISDAADRAQRIKHGAVPLIEINKAALATSAEFYQALVDDAEAAEAEFERLFAALDARCGAGAPGSANIRDSLKKCRHRIGVLAREKLGTSASISEAPAQSTSGAQAAGGPSMRVDGPIATRDQAFSMLLQVADFFKRTEPQSVLPFHLEEAVRFGRMSLPDLLTELINDSSVREQLFKRVGIPRTDGN